MNQKAHFARIHACLWLIIILLDQGVVAQTSFPMEDGMVQTCEGIFRDDGNNGPYSGDEFVFTICPDNATDFISIDFLAFNIYSNPNPNNSDYLLIFDGDNTGETSLGSYTGTQLQGLQVSSTVNNTSGCLTFQLISPSNNSAGLAGWEGNIQCGTPCANIVSAGGLVGPTDLVNNIPAASICVGDEVTFEDLGSTVDPGYLIENWTWIFGDGDTLVMEDDSDVSHVFNAPGAYPVQLTVSYPNDDGVCTSLNLDPMLVLVSTLPLFNTELESPICTGTTAVEGVMDGTPVGSIIWTDAPSYDAPTISPTGFDGGFTYCSQLELDVFPAGSVLENCEDLIQIDAYMEHSFLGDLDINISCPNGTTVTLQTQGGGGTFLGEPVDVEDDLTEGVCYAYGWSENSTLGQIEDPANATQVSYTDALGNPETGNIVNPGIYEPEGTLCDLVGCPLNGTWEFCFTDYLGLDNGFVCTWNLILNPDLYPGAIVIEPEIVVAEWDISPYIGSTDINVDLNPADPMILDISAITAGTYPFTFNIENDFGCTADTTVILEVIDPPMVSAGPDLTICGDGNLQAFIPGLPEPSCSDDAGSYTHCYTSGSASTFTYCPDDGAEGNTFMTVEFLSGSVEWFFDEFYVYDGPDNTGELLVEPPYYGNEGDLSGLSFTATNETGCLTLEVVPDFVIDCESSENIAPWEYVVGCTNTGDVNWSWTPEEYLQSSTGPSPALGDLGFDPITFEVFGEWSFLPGCGSTDQVTVGAGYSVNVSGIDPTCFQTDGEITVVLDVYNSEGPWSITLWDAESGNQVTQAFSATGANPIVFSGLPSGSYEVVSADPTCEIVEELVLTAPEVPELIVSNDTTICLNGEAVLSAYLEPAQPNETFAWSTNQSGTSINVGPNGPAYFTVQATYDLGCVSDVGTIWVDLYDPLSITLEPGGAVCPEDSIWVGVNSVTGGLPPYSYSWSGLPVASGEGFWASPDLTTVVCATMTDACETPAVDACVDVVVPDPVNADFEADTLGGCHPLVVNFSSNAVPGNDAIAQYNWTFGDGTVLNSGVSPEAAHSYLDNGLFTVTSTLTTEAGCIYEYVAENLIETFESPVASFLGDPLITALPETRVEFFNYSTFATSFLWEFGDLDTSELYETDYTFPDHQSGIYEITLHAMNDWGCHSEISRNVLINESFTLFIPSGFTPDQDGLNDGWALAGLDVDESDFLVRVFDRWGNVVYASNDIHEVWQGDNQQGDYFVADGTYTYIIITRSLATGDRKEVFGTITLTR